MRGYFSHLKLQAARRRAWLRAFGPSPTTQRVIWATVLLEVLVLVALAAGDNWPTLVGSFTAVGVAIWIGLQQLSFQKMMVRLNHMPWLSGFYQTERVGSVFLQVKNVGHGPAADIRAVLLSSPSHPSMGLKLVKLAARPDKSHLAPGEAAVIDLLENRPYTEGHTFRAYDVWIIHCADVLGRHYHLVSNPEAYEKPGTKGDRMWHFWTERQTRAWVRLECERCSERTKKRSARQALVDETADALREVPEQPVGS